ncbi:MAG: ligase-associated DNA damage response endonuclease PdeM [Bauldia sp.]|nr:ligase-associated DNA damage response endonuclease PdeM [Bauldia sp.]
MNEFVRPLEAESSSTPVALISVAGVELEALPPGALWWAEERLLVVADLHLEKGSSFARRGWMLPPYDTRSTLAALTMLVEDLDPRIVVTLGDSFHDGEAAGRMTSVDREMVLSLQRGRDWIWIAGNHDPAPPAGVGGISADIFRIGPLTFRHEPSPEGSALGEVAGHLHPAARVAGRLGSIRTRCFAGDGLRLVMPAFGAYAGGLNVLDPAFAGIVPHGRIRCWMLGKNQLYEVRRSALRHDDLRTAS